MGTAPCRSSGQRARGTTPRTRTLSLSLSLSPGALIVCVGLLVAVCSGAAPAAAQLLPTFEPTRLLGCSLHKATGQGNDVSCPAGHTVFSGGVDCTQEKNDFSYRSGTAESRPKDARTWTGHCQDDKLSADWYRAGFVWALCCPVLSNMDGPAYRLQHADEPRLPQWSECYQQNTNACPANEDLVAGGVNCFRNVDERDTLFRMEIKAANGGSGRLQVEAACTEVKHPEDQHPPAMHSVVCCKRSPGWFHNKAGQEFSGRKITRSFIPQNSGLNVWQDSNARSYAKLNYQLCPRNSIMTAIGLDCIYNGRDDAAQWGGIDMSLNAEADSYWRLQGHCVSNPRDWGEGYIIDGRGTASASCWPLACPDLPSAATRMTTWEWIAKNNSAGAAVENGQPMVPDEERELRCQDGYSFDGVGGPGARGAVTPALRRTCRSDTYLYSFPLPTCYKTPAATLAYTLSSSFREPDAVQDVQLTVTCADGTFPKGARTRPAQTTIAPTFECQPLPLVADALNATVRDSFSYTASWQAVPAHARPPQEEGTEWFYELQYKREWPAALSAADVKNDAALAGLQADNANTPFRVPGGLNDTSFTVVTDLLSQVGQVQSQFAVRIASSRGDRGNWTAMSSLVKLPCTCEPLTDAARNAWAGHLLPMPTRVQLKQSFDPEDSVLLELQNWSPCWGQVQLRRTNDLTNKTTTVDLNPIRGPGDCPKAATPVQKLKFKGLNYTGQEDEWLVTPVVRVVSNKVSPRLLHRYSTQAASAAAVPSIRTNFKLTSWATVAGRVQTAVTEESPQQVPFAAARVTAVIGRRVGSVWTPTADAPVVAFTDALGEYKLEVRTKAGVFAVGSGWEVRVRVNDTDTFDGFTVQHEYRWTGAQGSSASGEAVLSLSQSSQHFAAVDFTDKTHVMLSGKVSVVTSDTKWSTFTGCGVEGATVSAYRLAQVQRVAVADPKWILYEALPGAKPQRVSAVTLTDGLWSLPVPRIPTQVADASSTIVLVVSAPAHDFQQSHVYRLANSSRVQIDFGDVTQRTVTLSIVGGTHCKFDIGRAVPTFVHEGCASRKATMPYAFGSEPVAYTGAPAVRWVVKLWDPVYSAWFQPIGALLADEKAAVQQEMHEWFDKQPTLRADVRTVPSVVVPTVVFVNSTQMRLTREPRCRVLPQSDAAIAAQEAGEPTDYFLNPLDQSTPLTFRPHEVYSGKPCYQVDANIFLHDFTRTPPANAAELEARRFLDSHLPEEQRGCPEGCVRASSRVNDTVSGWTHSEVRYELRPDRVEWRKGIVWDATPGPPAPDYSFPLLFKSALSVLPPERVHVIVTGPASLLDGEKMTMRFPSAPLFILHAPPGGTSATSLEEGDKLELARQALFMERNGFISTVEIGHVIQNTEDVCIGAPGACKTIKVTKSGVKTKAINENDFNRGDQRTYKLSSGYTYTQSFTTAAARRGNGQDSVVLVYNALQRLVESMTVTPVLKADQTPDECRVQDAYSSITWLEGAVQKDYFQWVSRWEIENVILRQQQRVVDTLEAQLVRNGTNDDQVSHDTLSMLLKQELLSLFQWKETLAEFGRSIQRAVPFNPSLSETHGAAGHAMRSAYEELSEGNPLPEAGVGTLSKWPDRLGPIGSHASLDPARAGHGSLTDAPAFRARDNLQRQPTAAGYFVSYSGGGSATTLSIEMTAGEESEDEDHANINAQLGLQFTVKETGFSTTAKGLYARATTGSRTGSGSKSRTQKLHVTLGDGDIGDLFDVEIKIDKKYGTPVFVVHGGQSRCPYEDGTLPREHMRGQLGSAQTTFLPPDGIARVPLLLNNLSPTKEYWSYSVGMLPSSNSDGLHITLGGFPLLSNSLWWDTPQDSLTQLTLEISRAPHSPYTYRDVMITIMPVGAQGGTGDGMGTYGSNGGECVQDKQSYSEVLLSVSFQQECNLVEWSGQLRVMHQLTASNDPNTFSDQTEAKGGFSQFGGTPISIRNPEFQQPDRAWKLAAKPVKPGEPAQLTRISLRYRLLGGDETDWKDMVASDGSSPDLIALSSDVSGLAQLQWGTNNGLSDGVYEVVAQTRCFMPAGAIDSSLESASTPIKRVLIDHTAPTKLGEPAPGISLLRPETRISVTFTEPIQCLTPYSELKMRGWVHRGCPPDFPACSRNPYQSDESKPDPVPELLALHPRWHNESNGDGELVSLKAYCRDNVVDIAFAPDQSWLPLQGKLVTLMLWDIRDMAFNPMVQPLVWSFNVVQFDVGGSLMHVRRSEIVPPVAGTSSARRLLAAEGDQQEQWPSKEMIQREVHAIILAATRHANHSSASALGGEGADRPLPLLLEQIVVTNIERTPRGSAFFDFDILPSLQTTGAPLAPSDAASLYGHALEAGLFQEPGSFPLLANLRYTPAAERADSKADFSGDQPGQIEFTVDTVMRAEDLLANAAMEAAATPDEQLPQHALPLPPPVPSQHRVELTSTGRSVPLTVLSTSTLSPDAAWAIVQLDWHPNSTSGVRLTAAELSELQSRELLVRWRQVANLQVEDLDVIGEQEELDAAAWTEPLSTRTAPLSTLLFQSDAQGNARLRLLQLPSVVAGRVFEFQLLRADLDDVWLSLRVFVVGPPSPAVLLSGTQLSPANVSLSVRLPEWNGLLPASNAARFLQGDLRFDLTVSDSAAPNVSHPLRSFAFIDTADIPVDQLMLALDNVPSLSLPTPGTARDFTFTLLVRNGLAASAASSLTLSLAGVPTRLHSLRTRQLSLASYEVSVRVPTSALPIESYSGGYSFHLATGLHTSEAVNSTVRFSPHGSRVYLTVTYPVPYTSFGSLYIYVVASNRIGSSEPVPHRIYPTFISPPLLVSIEQLQAPAAHLHTQAAAQAAMLVWSPPRECSHPDLATGYLLRWSQTDAAGTEHVQLRRLPVGATRTNITGLRAEQPLRVDLYAVMNHSDNYYIRREPFGLHSIYSRPAAFSITLQQPLPGPHVQQVAQVADRAVRITAVVHQNASLSGKAEWYAAGYRCSAGDALWNGVTAVPSNWTLSSGGAALSLYATQLPQVADGSRLRINVTAFVYSRAGISSISTETGTEAQVALVGRPLPPLLAEISQSPRRAGQVNITLQLQLPALHTADTLLIQLRRMDVGAALLSSQRIPVPAPAFQLPADRLLRVVLAGIAVAEPLDMLTLTLSSSNTAGASSMHTYTLTVRSPAVPRFPDNCCSHRFRSPSVPEFALPANPATVSLNGNNALVHISSPLLPASLLWFDDCRTDAVEWWAEEERQWRSSAVSADGRSTVPLRPLFTMRGSGELRFKVTREELAAVSSVRNRLVRMTATCAWSDRGHQQAEPLCFQFTLTSPQSSNQDAELTQQVPRPTATCKSAADADADFASRTLLPPNITAVVQAGTRLLTIDGGIDAAFNGSSDSACTATRAAALAAASNPTYTRPTSAAVANTTSYPNEPLHMSPDVLPAPWLADEMAPTADREPDREDATPTSPQPDSISPTEPVWDAPPVTSSLAAAGVEPEVPQEEEQPEPEAEPQPEPEPEAETPTNVTPIDTTPVEKETVPVVVPAAAATAFSITLRGVAEQLVVQQPAQLISSFLSELAGVLGVSSSRLRVLKAVRGSGSSTSAAAPARSEPTKPSRMQRQAVDLDADASEEGVAPVAAAAAAAAVTTDARLTVVIEPTPSAAESSVLNTPSALHAFLVSAPPATYAATRYLSLISHIGDSAELPLVVCPTQPPTQHVSCSSDTPVFTEAASGIPLSPQEVGQLQALSKVIGSSSSSDNSSLLVALLGLCVCILLVLLFVSFVLVAPRLGWCRSRQLSSTGLPPLRLQRQSKVASSDVELPPVALAAIHTLSLGVSGEQEAATVDSAGAVSSRRRKQVAVDVDVQLPVEEPLPPHSSIRATGPGPLSPGNDAAPRVRSLALPALDEEYVTAHSHSSPSPVAQLQQPAGGLRHVQLHFESAHEE